MSSRGTIVKYPKAFQNSIFGSTQNDEYRYALCILDENDKPTGKTKKLTRTEFPTDLNFAVDCKNLAKDVSIVEYKLVNYWLFWKRAKITNFHP